MRDALPGGSLSHVLLPQTFWLHQTKLTDFTVLSVELWTTGIVVNIHMASEDDSSPSQPGLPRVPGPTPRAAVKVAPRQRKPEPAGLLFRKGFTGSSQVTMIQQPPQQLRPSYTTI